MREIKEIVGHPGDLLNKVRLFNEYIDKDVKISMPKVITILHGYHKKMEAAMAEVQKLVSVTTGESSRAPPPVQKETPIKEKNLDEVRTPLPSDQERMQSRKCQGRCQQRIFRFRHPRNFRFRNPQESRAEAEMEQMYLEIFRERFFDLCDS